MYKSSLFIFRRDLRAHDNTALNNALAESKEVIPCFILDPRLMEGENKNLFAIRFMLESLSELQQELSLLIKEGVAEEVVKSLIKKHKIDAVFLNRDYTPFSKKRDNNIREVCENNGVEFNSFEDQLLNSPDNILTGNNTPYNVFTPFYRKAREIDIAKPRNAKKFSFKRIGGSVSLEKYFPDSKSALRGGRRKALEILKDISGHVGYDKVKDYPAMEGTTKLSPHLKFGTVSSREVYDIFRRKLGQEHSLVRQLYWRDFWTYIAYHFPHVFDEAFHKKFDKIKWSYDKNKFQAWCNGQTGFPIVDAGMRELNATGYMHNRVRMVVASFLTKDLHIDWRWGMKYFAEKLVDHDPAVNNGNWQWAASTGCDAQPFFRVFNPWRQQKRFDSECKYIKKWVPEVKDYTARQIHSIEKYNVKDYPAPMVEHKQEAEKAKAAYRSVN